MKTFKQYITEDWQDEDGVWHDADEIVESSPQLRIPQLRMMGKIGGRAGILRGIADIFSGVDTKTFGGEVSFEDALEWYKDGSWTEDMFINYINTGSAKGPYDEVGDDWDDWWGFDVTADEVVDDGGEGSGKGIGPWHHPDFPSRLGNWPGPGWKSE